MNFIQRFLPPAAVAAGIIMLFWPNKKKREQDEVINEYAPMALPKDSVLFSEEGARVRAERKAILHPEAAHLRSKSMCHDFIYSRNFRPYFSGPNLNRHIARRFAAHYRDRKISGDSHYNLRHIGRSEPDEFERYTRELSERWKAS